MMNRVTKQSIEELDKRIDQVMDFYSEFLLDDDWGNGRHLQLEPFDKRDIPLIINFQREITRSKWLQLKLYAFDSTLMRQGWHEYRQELNKLHDMIESSKTNWSELMPFPFNNDIPYHHKQVKSGIIKCVL